MLFEIVCGVVIAPLVLILYSYTKHIWELKDYPPGPFPLPLIGNLHQLIEAPPYICFRELAKVYGDVFSISFGTERVVVINTIEPAKEALITRGRAYANRPKSYTYELLSRGYKTISFTDAGPYHNTIRKISHSALKMFGDGNERIETFILEESEYLHERLSNLNGKPASVQYEFGLSVLNVICELVFGHRYKAEDPEYKEVIDFTTLVFQGLACCDIIVFFPWLRHFPLDGITKLRKGLKIRDRLYSKKIEHHKNTYDPENIRDCTDAILKALNDDETLKKLGEQRFTNDHLEMLVNDIFVGGLETTATVLQWSLLYLLHWPQFQDQIYEEIIDIVGSDRYPTMNDRSNLHFTHAFIQETMRFSSLAPLGVPRQTTQNTEVAGIYVPENTQILFNLWNIHRDPRHWKEPESFNPHRFLNENGKYIVGTHGSFLPFSAGRRVCFGEALAKMELFLFLSRLLRDYSINKVPEEELPSLEGKLGITLAPSNFNVIFKPRNNNLTS